MLSNQMDPCKGNAFVQTDPENYLSAKDQHIHKLPTSLNKLERKLVSSSLNENFKSLKNSVEQNFIFHNKF